MKTGKFILKVALGSIFILLGIIGLFLPFIPGLLFLLLGALLLFSVLPGRNRLLKLLLKRYPKLVRHLRR